MDTTTPSFLGNYRMMTEFGRIFFCPLSLWLLSSLFVIRMACVINLLQIPTRDAAQIFIAHFIRLCYLKQVQQKGPRKREFQLRSQGLSSSRSRGQEEERPWERGYGSS